MVTQKPEVAIKVKEMFGNLNKLKLSENPPVPDSNVKAKNVAKGKTNEAKLRAKQITGKVSGKETKEVKKPKEFTIHLFGQDVIRRTVGGKVIFVDVKSNKPIVDFLNWIEVKSKDKSLMAKVEQDTKPFVDKLSSVTPKQRVQATKQLNAMSIFKLQNGADVNGNIAGKAIEIAAVRAQAVLSRKSSNTYSVLADLDKIKNSKYLDYQHVLPVNARTIIVRRGGRSIVCVRTINMKQGGSIAYIDITTLKKISMNKGDQIEIIGSIDSKDEKFKKVMQLEAQLNKTRIQFGFAWNKLTEKPERIAARRAPKPTANYKSTRGSAYSKEGGYSGGGGDTGNTEKNTTAPVSTSKSNPSLTPISSFTKPTVEKWNPHINESKEVGGEYNIKTVKNPEINGGRPIHFYTPEKIDPKKPVHFVYYFHGYTSPKGAAKELLTKPTKWSKQHALEGLKDLAKDSKKNIVLIMPEGESGRSRWPELHNAQKFQQLEDLIKQESGIKKVTNIKRFITGHSGANFGMFSILKNAPKNYFDGLAFYDSLYSASYGSVNAYYQQLLRHDKMKVFARYRRGGTPYRNCSKLLDKLKKEPGTERKIDRDLSFETAGLNHTLFKAPGLRDSMRFFLGQENSNYNVSSGTAIASKSKQPTTVKKTT